MTVLHSHTFYDKLHNSLNDQPDTFDSSNIILRNIKAWGHTALLFKAASNYPAHYTVHYIIVGLSRPLTAFWSLCNSSQHQKLCGKRYAFFKGNYHWIISPSLCFDCVFAVMYWLWWTAVFTCSLVWHHPFWDKGFALFKKRQLLLQLDLRQSISVMKKKMVRGSPSPPLVPACPCLAIHLPQGLSQCTPDSLTRCWKAAPNTPPPQCTGGAPCNIQA